MDEKTLLESLAQGVKDGKFTIEQIPEVWREKVRKVVAM